jgi:hypothetical protein
MRELHEEVLDSINEFYGGDKYSLSKVNTDIYLKSQFFEDINKRHLNSEIVDKVNISHKRMFNHIREQVAEAITSMKSNTPVAKESAIEVINSIFKVMEHRAVTITQTQISSKEV